MPEKTKKSAYKVLHELSKVISIQSSIQAVLEWDQETYMPQGAISFRASQVEALAGQIHKLKTSPKFTRTLNQLINLESGQIVDETVTPAQASALKEWRREHLKSIKLPSSFIKKFANTTSNAVHAWADAKRKNSFQLFLPHLEKIVDLCRKKADLLGYQEHAYDALLDLYEPGLKISSVAPLFGRLKIGLTSLLKSIVARPQIDDTCLQGDFPADKQMQFAHFLLEKMGFDRQTSRLDQSVHPFCMGLYPKDTRMTTWLSPNSLMSHLFSVLHEGGHGLYNMNLPESEFGSPLGEQSSLGIDESQSRFWETIIGRHHAFWKYFYPHLQATFPAFAKVSLDDFHRAINMVRPSLIRTESDEVTYCLHVLVRFEIEQGLIEGSLKVKNLPEVWNEKMRTYLGIAPQRDDEGCLQDIHWSMGSLGYFPTYALGNLYAAQLFAAFQQSNPHWQEKVAAGDLSGIREWLHQHIHKFGRQYLPEELIQRATGKPLSEEPYLHYLENKYKALYH